MPGALIALSHYLDTHTHTHTTHTHPHRHIAWSLNALDTYTNRQLILPACLAILKRSIYLF